MAKRENFGGRNDLWVITRLKTIESSMITNRISPDLTMRQKKSQDLINEAIQDFFNEAGLIKP